MLARLPDDESEMMAIYNTYDAHASKPLNETHVFVTTSSSLLLGLDEHF